MFFQLSWSSNNRLISAQKVVLLCESWNLKYFPAAYRNSQGYAYLKKKTHNNLFSTFFCVKRNSRDSITRFWNVLRFNGTFSINSLNHFFFHKRNHLAAFKIYVQTSKGPATNRFLGNVLWVTQCSPWFICLLLRKPRTILFVTRPVVGGWIHLAGL